MSYIVFLLISLLSSGTITLAQSNLLESVKKNPAEAKSICAKFRELNKKGISASSKESINSIAKEKNLNRMDAEILSMYIRGLHCPNVD